MEKLYHYQGTVSEISVRDRQIYEIKLHDINDEDKPPIRLSVGGGLARYIYEIEMTDVEERYLVSNWYYDSNLYLRYIEVLSRNEVIPAKIIAQANPWDENVVIFGEQNYILSDEPEPMSMDETNAWLEWRRNHLTF